jgi:1-acyl-sn-glycerol-3-phosphate acyltransferase
VTEREDREVARAVAAGADDRALRKEDLHLEAHRGAEMTLGRRAFYRFVWFVVQFIGRTYFRLQVVGSENVPKTGAFIVAPIHRSNLDTPVVAAITRRRLRYMGKASMWKTSAGAWFLTSLGGFPVRRGTADREALNACIEVLERGEPLVMFPEGTRQHGPNIAEVFDGPAYVAAKARVPIVPVGIGGSEAVQPKGSKMVRPAKMTLVVGTPIRPPEPGPNGRVPRRAVRELTERLAKEIQVLFDEAQVLAGRPNRH